MKIISNIIGNINQKEWAEKLKEYTVEFVNLDQWTAQKSRFIIKDTANNEYAITLDRHIHIEDGDIIYMDRVLKHAAIIKIELSPVLVVNISKILSKEPHKIAERCLDMGHAIGNQHWPVLMKGNSLYIPLTIDKKVMVSVMETHNFPDITYEFQQGKAIIPFLTPSELRTLFAGAAQHVHEGEKFINTKIYAL